jgi:hypothetical protein
MRVPCGGEDDEMWNLLHRLLRDALTNGKDEPEEQVLLVTCLGLT